jgi:hypothetical protein
MASVLITVGATARTGRKGAGCWGMRAGRLKLLRFMSVFVQQVNDFKAPALIYSAHYNALSVLAILIFDFCQLSQFIGSHRLL